MRNTLDKDLESKLESKVKDVGNLLGITDIGVDDLASYFDTESPYGDTTTLEDVTSSKWLLVHELYEIHELKKMGFEISGKLLYSNPEEVNTAHVAATKVELEMAFADGDTEWVKLRLRDVRNWVEDPDMTAEQLKSCEFLLERYAGV